MRINNNLMAYNAQNKLNINNNNVADSVRKLSSGLRISRAGDDAAGLAISEKMRAQIEGLDMASKNSQDAISLIQTAEGSLNETHSILQRMRELAVQSASDTNQDAVDRESLDLELEQLKSEIDDISSNTAFNNMKLLDGSFGSTVETNFAGLNDEVKVSNAPAGLENATFTLDMTVAGGATAGEELEFVIGNATDSSLNSTSVIKTNEKVKGGTGEQTFTLNDSTGKYDGMEITISFDAKTAPDAAIDITDVATSTDGVQIAAAADKAVGGATYDAISVDGKFAIEISGAGDEDGIYVSGANLTDTIGNGGTLNFTRDDGEVLVTTQVNADASATTFASVLTDSVLATTTTNVIADDEYFTITESAPVIQSGANEGEVLTIEIGDMSTSALGLTNTDISSRENASDAITEIDDAINSVSTERSNLGAYQNRLEHKIKNLDTSSENLQAAESRIRDLDMAAEMTEFTSNNILAQAATSMLAQANSLPQNVLSLLG